MLLCLVAWLAADMLCAAPASAQQFPMLVHPQNNEICPITYYNAASYDEARANRFTYGVVKRMVYCVQGLVIPATYQIMYAFSVYYIYAPVAAACTLAVAIWGIMMAMGKSGANMREAFMVAIKVGGVMMFTYVLGASDIWPYGLYPVLIGIMDELAGIVSTYIGYSSSMGCAVYMPTWDVWGRVDAALNTLVGGIFNPTLLMGGLSGFLIAAFFSGTFGLFIAIAGFAIIFMMMFAILRAAYITITAYLAVSLMAIISPIFITMILFKSTFGYFEKWLKLVIHFMLQPLFLFAYLSMMLAAFDTVVYDGPFSVYRALIGPKYIGSYPMRLPAYPVPNAATNPCGDFLIGKFIFDKGVYRYSSAAATGVNINPRSDSHLEVRNTGMGGNMGAKELPADAYNERDEGGIKKNVLDTFAPMSVFKVDMSLRQVAWQYMAFMYYDKNPYNMTQQERDALTVNYLVQLFLALLIAFVTMYIFYQLLDVLPFIGSGISGDKFNMPSFGKGGLMPGKNIIKKIQEGTNKLSGGGGGK